MANGEIINEPVFKIKTFTGAAYSSLATDGSKNYSAANCNFEVPDGYEVFGIRYVSSGNYRVSLSEFYPVDETTRFIGVRNTYSSAQSGTPSISVTFINKKYLEYGLRRSFSLTVQEGITVECSEYNGDVLVGQTITLTVSDPQVDVYILHIDGLESSFIALNSSNGYSYSFTMPDNDVSLNLVACYLLTINISPYTSATINSSRISPIQGMKTTTPSGAIYYCEANETIMYRISQDYYNYTIQSATLDGQSLTVQEDTFVNFVMPSADAILNATLVVQNT